ncbi:MAG: NAD(P)H-dependent oxidoreductase [Alphaproteobacteria bacterium]|nr:NAD(P)H-dependent oxidoreductase [Alphaproteobacteria bacterium]
MPKSIAIIQGHPDPSGTHFCHALAEAYADGASSAGHDVERIDVAGLEFPLLRTRESFENDPPPASILECQRVVERAGHLVIIYPLWLGTMPALLKAFLEQLMRPGFAFQPATSGPNWKKLLGGKSARIVVTMDMPAIFYRWYFGAHSLKSLERNILRFCGIRPIRESLIGGVAALDPAKAGRWLSKFRDFGRRGD